MRPGIHDNIVKLVTKKRLDNLAGLLHGRKKWRPESGTARSCWGFADGGGGRGSANVLLRLPFNFVGRGRFPSQAAAGGRTASRPFQMRGRQRTGL